MEKRMKYGRALLLSFIAGLATYSFLFHSSWCSHAQTKEAAMHISTPDLLGLFDKNEVVFDREYLNKVVSMQGVVKKIKKIDGEDYILYLGRDPDQGPSVRCSLDSLYNHAPLPVKTGDSITLSGTCAGRLMDIILIQCIIKK